MKCPECGHVYNPHRASWDVEGYYRKYWDEKWTTFDIAAEVHIRPKNVRQAFLRRGFKMRTREEAYKLERKIDYDLCVNLYKAGWSLREVGAHFNVAAANVKAVLDKKGVATRSVQHGIDLYFNKVNVEGETI